MIPALMLFGLVLGRWWRVSLIAAAVGWPILLVASDVVNIELALLTASALAVANTGVGVLVHQGFLWVTRNCRRFRSSQSGA
ncbi:hypothetical protein ACFQZ8_00285 [Micromonospora azadirachtae]|uniref:Uncharacterized protein n=1 Tax=Micromonospora azadirachtae TaxID=1970735 RepID=A0ABW2ZVL1_9ACTN